MQIIAFFGAVQNYWLTVRGGCLGGIQIPWFKPIEAVFLL